jgi:hypothetical protein
MVLVSVLLGTQRSGGTTGLPRVEVTWARRTVVKPIYLVRLNMNFTPHAHFLIDNTLHLIQPKLD